MRLSTPLSLFLCAAGAAAQVTVLEPATRAVLVNGRTVVSLALQQSGSQPVDVRIALQWLNPDGQPVAKEQRDATLPPGETTLSIRLGLCETCDPLLLRLSYSVQPGSRNFNAFPPVSGMLSLPNIAGHAFVLRVLTAGDPVPSEPFDVRVFAAHPVTGAPVAGVSVTADPATATTNKDGLALLRVTREPDDEGPIEVEAQLGDFQADAASTPLSNRKEQLLAYTDKPIYQPGQTMHVRLLALAQNGRAKEDAEIDLGIGDEAGEFQFRTKLRTSRYGIASADWEIPTTADSGRYTVRVKTNDGDFVSLRDVQIRRYELPSFRVAVQPDRPFYLIGEAARISIQGDYLFGKPVSEGRVRLVAADDEDKVIAEGAVSREGRFQAMLPAAPPFDSNTKFEDRHYLAFLTDGTTNRTEQRKFVIRVSRDPVHVYVARQESHVSGRRLYVTTYSPDGLPLGGAAVEVTVGAQVIGRGRTNRFGLVRLDLPAARAPQHPEMQLTATTGDSKRARVDVPFYDSYTEPVTLSLDSDKTLYREGQPVRCTLDSAGPQTVFLLALNQQNQVVFTRSLRVDQGRTVVAIPYDRRFGRAVSIGVAASGGPERLPVRRVYYPGQSEFVIQAKPLQRSFRPGETAVLELQTSSPAALGIAIVDQSVRERAATDTAFGAPLWQEQTDPPSLSLGGISEASLPHLDPAKVEDADLQLVAELLAGDSGALFFSGRDESEDLRRAFQREAIKSLAPVKRALDLHYLDTLEHPADESALQRIAGHVLAR
ncbi:MAG: hypothetical protein JNK87_15500, partial [Bryobacterales bacterium]|nr:hypothetical protein [Bryobacterales bacterium]